MRKASIADASSSRQARGSTPSSRVEEALALWEVAVVAYMSLHGVGAGGRLASAAPGAAPPAKTLGERQVGRPMSRSTLRRITDQLTRANVHFALIGATALAARGYSRSTADVELLVADTLVLSGRFWDPVRRFVTIDVRAGDIDDPLAGVIRAGPRARLPVDVVAIPSRYNRRILDRAVSSKVRATILGAQLPVASAADILLL